MSSSNIESIALEVAELSTQIKDLTERKKKLEEDLRPALVDRGPTRYGEFVFNCTISPGRKTLDKDALKADGIDPDKYMKQGKPFSTLKITRYEAADVEE